METFAEVAKNFCITKTNTEPKKNNVVALLEKGEHIMKYKNVTVIRKPNTKIWWARFRRNGKINCVYGKTQLECYQNLKDAINNKTIENKISKQKYTLKQWYDYFMETYKINSAEIKPSTLRDNAHTFNNFSDYFDKNISSFNEIIIKQMINKCNGDRLKQKAYILLHSLFKKAVDNNIISKDPMINLDKPKYQAPEKNCFSAGEQKEFLKYALSYNNQIHGDFLAICLLQGFTRGECWSLSVEKLDFEKSTIVINECIKETDKHETGTKNVYRNRTVPMFEQTKLILEKYKNKKGKIFEIKPKALYEDLKNICNIAKVPNLTIHELRHTFITRCQERGIPLYIIQSWVGHRKGSKVTTEVYTHITNNITDKYINYMNEKI